MQFEHSIELTLDASRFPASEVALHTLGAHDLARGRNFESALGALVRLKLLLLHGDSYLPARARWAFA